MPLRHSPPYQSRPSLIDRELSGLVADAPQIEKLAVPAAFHISAALEGPKVVIFGSIHGDEPAGSLAVKELLTQFADCTLKLLRGSVILAVGNELALEQRVRKVERDLNRLFEFESIIEPSGYEERRAEELRDLLAGADYMMDLHATSKSSSPFLMCESHLLAEAQAMGFARIVTGWGELGEASLGGDTESYINQMGGKGFTVETGQRDDAEGCANALDAARRLLRHVSLLPYEAADVTAPAIYKLFASIKVEEATFKYRQPFGSFNPLVEGELIGCDANKEYRAPCDCVLVMPSNDEFMLARRRSN
ncbi:MAG: succinylglutamate desuccinylase [Chthoniobacter sp.]|nr:succinylglutamate desuccinylase [Chthoniobacter sp.]